MTKLEALTKQFQSALGRMEEILQSSKTVITCDAALKRFEFTFDLAWKTLREYLREKKGIECSSPKECMREGYRHGIIAYDRTWIDMVDWRNDIVHEYSEDYADDLYTKLPQVFELFRQLYRAATAPPAVSQETEQ